MSKENCKICFSSILKTNLLRHFKTVHKDEYLKTLPKMSEKNDKENHQVETVHTKENLVTSPRDQVEEARKFTKFNVKKYLGLRIGSKMIEVKVLMDVGEKRQSGWFFVGKFHKVESFKKYLDNTARYSKKGEARRLARTLINQLKNDGKSEETLNVEIIEETECSICNKSVNVKVALRLSGIFAVDPRPEIVCKKCIQNLTENCKNILNQLFCSSTASNSSLEN
jgi:hypothetical protein